MAFKFKGCDKSDMETWATCPASIVFFDEVKERRAAALRRLLKIDHEDAVAIRELDRVLTLYKEAQN